uniref:MUS1 n=1 Tax=Arundo donax TaxID=35708 RepID=A0A0A9G9L3_ARUDO
MIPTMEITQVRSTIWTATCDLILLHCEH